MLERNEMPIYEPGLDALVERNVKAGRLTFTTDLKTARSSARSSSSSRSGTPQGNDGRADLSFVREVARAVAENSERLQGRRDEEHGPGGNRDDGSRDHREAPQGDARLQRRVEPGVPPRGLGDRGLHAARTAS